MKTRGWITVPALAIAACAGDGTEACDPAPGEICTIAGSGVAGFAGDEGAATDAKLYLPMDVTLADGVLYVMDWNNHRIRAVDAGGTIRTVAGTGLLGDGPDGPALEHDFNHPTEVTIDPQGRLIIAAWHNSKIKVLDPTTGLVTDMCGTGGRSYLGDGGPANKAVLDLPASVAFDRGGNMYIMDQANQVIRRVDPAGNITRIAGQCITTACQPGEAPVKCPMNDKWSCASAGDAEACMKPCLGGFGGDDGPAMLARMSQPFGQAADPAGRMAIDDAGNILFADTKNHRVRRISADGMITTIAGSGQAGFAGDGGPAREAQLSSPVDVVLAADGTLYIADTFNSCVRALGTDGTLRTAAGVCGQRGFAGDGGPATAANLDRPYGLAAADGRLYIADTHNNRVRVVGL
jgi:sugar lactone lactonase YvrE